MKICIIGTGYVGLVTGACFAETGNTVSCVDNNADKIQILNSGNIPLYEPGLESLVAENVARKRLFFLTDLGFALSKADVCFIAVGTPQDEDGAADLKHVLAACSEICRVAQKKVILATKSTVPVGTGDTIEKIFKEGLKQDFVVFANPEFLREGNAVSDFMKPDRIVIGTNDEGTMHLMKELYAPYTHQRSRLIFMDRRSAELTKYAANSMLALRIAFMNEVANLSDKIGANVNSVRLGLGADKRIGPAYLYPGLGYGGSCFPKDVKALIALSRGEGSPLLTIEACDQVNHEQVKVFFAKICAHFGGVKNLQDKKIAFWGLSFKANTDDIRESQAIKLLGRLHEVGCILHVTDPQSLDNVKLQFLGAFTYHDDHMACLDGASALIVATDWSVYKSPDFAEIKRRLRSPVIFDARNLYDPRVVRAAGLTYIGVGVK